MSYQTLTLKYSDQIAYIELARPEKHNALNITMFNEIDGVIKTLKKNKDIRVVIVSGQGESFCSGLDVKSVLSDAKSSIRLLFKWLPWQANLAQRVSTAWRKVPVPVIFALHGKCWGGGLQIALGGDFRIATPDVSIAIMEARWGLIPDMGGTLALKELIKLDVAKELAMTGKIIDGQQALSTGLITKISDDPLAQATLMAQEIINQSPDAITACKKLYNKSWWGSAGMALARESFYQLRIICGKNFRIKGYNQTHDKSEHKNFKQRMRW